MDYKKYNDNELIYMVQENDEYSTMVEIKEMLEQNEHS